MSKRISRLITMFLMIGAASAQAYTLTFTSDRTGHDEREDAPSAWSRVKALYR